MLFWLYVLCLFTSCLITLSIIELSSQPVALKFEGLLLSLVQKLACRISVASQSQPTISYDDFVNKARGISEFLATSSF